MNESICKTCKTRGCPFDSNVLRYNCDFYQSTFTRNPNRIDAFCARLAELWKKVPDLRFGQFVLNVFSQHENDEFYMEDGDMIKLFEQWVQNVKGDE